ncbi:unnamed protein product, partial [Brassica oleracea var. botrytis]
SRSRPLRRPTTRARAFRRWRLNFNILLTFPSLLPLSLQVFVDILAYLGFGSRSGKFSTREEKRFWWRLGLYWIRGETLDRWLEVMVGSR